MRNGNFSLKGLLLALCCSSIVADAQLDSLLKNVSVHGYIEAYYCYDSSNPKDHERGNALYSFNRHNEVAINLAMIKLNFDNGSSRANVGLMAGTYALYNLAQEPGNLQNIYEANVGVRLSKKQDLWFDMGVMPSHIGFESAIGQDCWNLTRSLVADNTPYYENGARLSYTSPSKRWYLSALALNGWQRMWMTSANLARSFGHQITFKPNSKWTINSSSFAGNTSYSFGNLTRLYHNFYTIYTPTEKWGITANFDCGLQESELSPKFNEQWWSGVLAVRRVISNQLALAARIEQYYDPNQIQITYYTLGNFDTKSASLNLDWKISDNAMWRFEGRAFSKDFLKSLEGAKTEATYAFTTSLSMKF